MACHRKKLLCEFRTIQKYFIYFFNNYFLVVSILTFKKITYEFKARENFERIVQYFLLVCSTLAILITIGIILSVLFESNRFFNTISITEFLFGTHWSPQMPIREDQVGSSGAFGAIPLLPGLF